MFPFQPDLTKIESKEFVKWLTTPSLELKRIDFWKNLLSNPNPLMFKCLEVWADLDGMDGLEDNVVANFDHKSCHKWIPDLPIWIQKIFCTEIKYIVSKSWFVNCATKPLTENMCVSEIACMNPHMSSLPIIEKIMEQTFCDSRNLVRKLNYLSANTNPRVKPLLEKYIERYYYSTWGQLLRRAHEDVRWWRHLSVNPAMVSFMEQRPERIVWSEMSKNEYAEYLLERNKHMINWVSLSENPCAIRLQKQNLDKLDMVALASNPNVIQIVCGMDLDKMQAQMADFKEELQMAVLHPLRLMSISEQWGMSMEEYVDCIM